MKKAPYSLTEAQKVCEDFQCLTGKLFDKDITSDIDCVVITPYDEANKKRFFLYYMLFDDADIALNHEYNGSFYDVVVIAGAKDEYGLLQQDLYSWLAKNRSLPVYTTVVSELVPVPVTLAYQQ